MAAELERVGRLRRLLEPLAVLYEKVVSEACKESFEVRLSVWQSTDHPGEYSDAAEPMHIIDGESLQAAYEVWLEYRLIERQLLDQSGAPISDNKGGDHTVEISAPNETVLEEMPEDLIDGEQLGDGLSYLSTSERRWLEWFYSLSEEDKKIVELCGEKGNSVTPANFSQLKNTVRNTMKKTSA